MHSHRLNVSPKILYAIAISTEVVLFSVCCAAQQSKKMEYTSARTHTTSIHKSIEEKDEKRRPSEEKKYARNHSLTHPHTHAAKKRKRFAIVLYLL